MEYHRDCFSAIIALIRIVSHCCFSFSFHMTDRLGELGLGFDFQQSGRYIDPEVSSLHLPFERAWLWFSSSSHSKNDRYVEKNLPRWMRVKKMIWYWCFSTDNLVFALLHTCLLMKIYWQMFYWLETVKILHLRMIKYLPNRQKTEEWFFVKSAFNMQCYIAKNTILLAALVKQNC